uniref:SFRICE_022542 n=1 Tax=Spodoptera frugiperda TaxID=7108 RepID=A0A2H1W617_SPOFR
MVDRNNILWVAQRIAPSGNRTHYTLHGSQLPSHHAKRAVNLIPNTVPTFPVSKTTAQSIEIRPHNIWPVCLPGIASRWQLIKVLQSVVAIDSRLPAANKYAQPTTNNRHSTKLCNHYFKCSFMTVKV